MKDSILNCFVIMPFATEFDDVYATIKNTVESAIVPRAGGCFRLDEARPAGRITDRLLRELEVASFCVADVTGANPNVMWELGYAMALKKPTIILTQDIRALPFDIRDMQSLEYDRTRLARTLGEPLKRMVLDTLDPSDVEDGTSKDELVGALLSEIQEVKAMLRTVVSAWGPDSSASPLSPTHGSLRELVGAWVNAETDSHFYAEILNGDLVVPYCYRGDDDLTGVYYGWNKLGEYWFARFKWIQGEISGFAFLKQDSIDIMSGAWWHDDEVVGSPSAPPREAGVGVKWERKKAASTPPWARAFLDSVRERGLSDFSKSR